MKTSLLDLSIIIVNWNTAPFLIRCLHSIYETTKKVNFEIFVVDNGSKDNSVEVVRNEFPKVKLIVNEKNKGFPKANNQAIKISQGEYILLLNPDTVVRKNTIDGCVEYLREHSDVGALGVKIYNPNGIINLHCARRFPTLVRLFWETSLLNKIFPKSKYFSSILLNHWDHNDSQEIERISGVFMMVPKRVFDDVGLLDENQFMYAEDTDLCFRIRKYGLKVYYFADYSIIHFGGQSSKQVSIQSLLYLYDSHNYIFKKYYGQKVVVQWKLIVLFRSILKAPMILIGIIILGLFKRKNKYFTFLNFKRQVSLVKWAFKSQ